MTDINYKERILNVLEIEKVSYQMEIARRIDIFHDRTIKFVIKEMVKEGEIEESDDVHASNRIKLKFYWLPGTYIGTINKIRDFKMMLMRYHLEYSNVQKNFGPKIAVASLRALTQKGILPLKMLTIRGPVKKWYGPLGTWKGNEVTVPSGDIDVIALEGEDILWVGEVKMRSDYVKLHQINHFLSTIKNFRDKIFKEKSIYYKLKPFFLAPIFSNSAKNLCRITKVSMIMTKKIYYPLLKSGKDIEWFYDLYRTHMGISNLELIDSDNLPIDIISMEFQRRPFQKLS